MVFNMYTATKTIINKAFLISCLLLLTTKAFSQRFLQYNTGTLYDSFENPSQRSFIPDSSRQFAINYFPNINTSTYISGEGQTALKTRIFADNYNTDLITVGTGRNNYINSNTSAYLVMLKIFTSLEGSREIGFSIKTNFESRGIVTNESLALFGGYTKFTNNSYTNIFNDRFFYQTYQQFAFNMREQVNDKLALGFKLGLLSGLKYYKLTVNQSQIDFDKPNNEALLSLSGLSYSADVFDGGSALKKAGLTFRNPGISISLGAQYKNDSGYNFQFNVKDLGFIHWNNTTSQVAYFAKEKAIISVSPTFTSEEEVKDKVDDFTAGNRVTRGYNFPINGVAEVSVNRNFWFDYDRSIKFSPTVIIQKELFYNGLTGAIVAPVQYDKFGISLVTSYNDLKMMSIGGQFMIKTPNSEFFIGSDAFIQSVQLVQGAAKGSRYVPTPQGRFSGGSFFIGFSLKFGNYIESPMNASYIPNGEKGFIGRLYDKIFRKDRNY